MLHAEPRRRHGRKAELVSSPAKPPSNTNTNTNTSTQSQSVHELADSLLDLPDATPQNLGASTVLLIFVVMTLLNETVNSLRTYGWLMHPIDLLLKAKPSVFDVAAATVFLSLTVILIEVTLACEILLCTKPHLKWGLRSLEGVVLTVALAAPLVYDRSFSSSQRNLLFEPACWYICLVLKLFSFVHCNSEIRARVEMSGADGEAARQQYVRNLSRKKVYYFILAPTLCYEVQYPHNSAIRPLYIVKKLLKMALVGVVAACMLQQLLFPNVLLSVLYLRDGKLVDFVLSLLPLCVYTNVLWQLFAYLWFHCLLNLMGEILRFGDRRFHGDWWNASSLEYFWRSWNIPVHRWMKLHVYLPLILRGFSPKFAALVVFLLSAILHEYPMTCLLGGCEIWAFLLIFSTIPATILINCASNAQVRNLLVWLGILSGHISVMIAYSNSHFDGLITNLSNLGINVTKVVANLH